jgi:phenolic acid decarboxylase
MIAVKGSYTTVLPHQCDFSEHEKGATHSVRQLAHLEPISVALCSREDVEAARIHCAIWVPDWVSDQPERPSSSGAEG